MLIIYWIILLSTMEGQQFEFPGTLQECETIAKARTSKNSNIQSGCYEVHTYINKPFIITIK